MLVWLGLEREAMCVYHYLFDGAAGGAKGAAHETMRALLRMGAAVWHKDLQARPLVVMLGAASTRSERSVGGCVQYQFRAATVCTWKLKLGYDAADGVIWSWWRLDV